MEKNGETAGTNCFVPSPPSFLRNDNVLSFHANGLPDLHVSQLPQPHHAKRDSREHGHAHNHNAGAHHPGGVAGHPVSHNLCLGLLPSSTRTAVPCPAQWWPNHGSSFTHHPHGADLSDGRSHPTAVHPQPLCWGAWGCAFADGQYPSSKC